VKYKRNPRIRGQACKARAKTRPEEASIVIVEEYILRENYTGNFPTRDAFLKTAKLAEDGYWKCLRTLRIFVDVPDESVIPSSTAIPDFMIVETKPSTSANGSIKVDPFDRARPLVPVSGTALRVRPQYMVHAAPPLA
jgi:hypothetical protein